ncbi:hypothetical protein CA51_49880 [Rosistilla oblonga]|uniref:hypothetical protein n=1 Tax=Rosistilla oblonga TaxID=2527990 RepID=UPI0011881F9D|nr:hypothetical protein [Rosistilla oblonga]QDV15077.1 hypothetical protein CA51_49880 [Rosistilla oblonga]
MNTDEFEQAKSFIYRDIEREIALARLSNDTDAVRTLAAHNVAPGGANLLSALGLLCYTEFAGKLEHRHKYASHNFNNFFDKLGRAYSDFRKNGHNVYDIFRCGLAHEYYVKKSCVIAMFGSADQAGVGLQADGRYYFIVDRYFRDFQLAFDALEKRLFP